MKERALKTLGELADCETIRDVLYRHRSAVDRGNKARMKHCYHPLGTDDHAFFRGSGWDFADYVLPTQAQLDRSIHSPSVP